MFKKIKNLIQSIKDLNIKLTKMEETVEFFSGIAELFANYIVYDIGSHPPRGQRELEHIQHCANEYLSKRKIFWRDIIK